MSHGRRGNLSQEKIHGNLPLSKIPRVTLGIRLWQETPHSDRRAGTRTVLSHDPVSWASSTAATAPSRRRRHAAYAILMTPSTTKSLAWYRRAHLSRLPRTKMEADAGSLDHSSTKPMVIPQATQEPPLTARADVARMSCNLRGATGLPSEWVRRSFGQDGTHVRLVGGR